MTTFLSHEVQAGLDAARKAERRRTSRLSLQAGSQSYRVLRAWEGGFALESEVAPHLRGLVDLYEGARLVSQCLIVASEEEADEIRFEYKRVTEATDEQPLDFERAPNAPVGLLGKP